MERGRESNRVVRIRCSFGEWKVEGMDGRKDKRKIEGEGEKDKERVTRKE